MAPVASRLRLPPSVLILGVIALLAAGSVLWLAVTPVADDLGVARALTATADAVDEHASAMIDHGGRLATAARASAGPDRDHWIADGEHMVSDGVAMRSLAARVRASAVRLGEAPTRRAIRDPDLLRAQGTLLKGEARSAIEHGRAMGEHARVMAELAARPGSGITPADVDLMARDAGRIVDAGERVDRVCAMILAAADRMDRWLGHAP